MNNINYLAGLNQFVKLHGIAQGIKQSQLNDILQKINRIEGDGSGSWVGEFSQVGDNYYQQKKYDKAMCFYNLARFACFNQANNINITKKSIIAFNLWNIKNGYFFIRDEYVFEEKSIPFYFHKSKNQESPLLIVIGGIVSTKEQWSNILNIARKLDITTAVLEMPGVGENATIYNECSFKLFAQVIIKMNNYANINQIHIIGLSFGGNLAIRYALKDNRVKSIFTVGAPILYFYHNYYFSKVPDLTKKILSHLCLVDDGSVFDAIKQNGISNNELKLLNIPVNYVFSLQDEIIPCEEKSLLIKFIKKLNLYEFDDVHGSPHHMLEIKMILIRYILSLSNRKKLLNYLLGKFLTILNFRNKFKSGERV